MAPIDRVIGNRLRTWRKERRLLQADAAKALDVQQSTIVRIERGLHSTSLGNLDRLAQFYGYTLQDLVADMPAKPEDPKLIELKALWYRMDAPERAALRTVMAGLAAQSPPRDRALPPLPKSTPRTRRATRAASGRVQ